MDQELEPKKKHAQDRRGLWYLDPQCGQPPRLLVNLQCSHAALILTRRSLSRCSETTTRKPQNSKTRLTVCIPVCIHL